MLVAGRADQVIPQFFAALADPAVLPGWIAVDEGMVRHIACDHGTRPYEGIAPDGCSADDGAVSSQTGPFFDQGWPGLIHPADMSPGIEYIGEDHAGAAEDIIFQRDALVDADVVLHLAAVADGGVRTDDDVLTDIAVFANDRTGHHMAEVPDFRTATDTDSGINAGRFVGEPRRIVHARASLRAAATCRTCASSR